MSVGQVNGRTDEKGTAYPEAHRPNGLVQLLALTGHSINLRARGALIWGVALGALGAVFVAIYPYLEGAAGMQQMISNMPQAMQDMLGYGPDALSSVEAFMGAEMLSLLVPLALSLFPILLASSALAGAEEDGTIDILMGNPLSRWQLVLGRFLAAAVLLLGIVAIMGSLSWITAVIAGVELSPGLMAAASLSLWPLCLFFGGIALLLSAILHRRFLALAIPAALLIVMYFVDALASSVEFFETIQPLSAFYYYGSAIEDGMDWTGFGVLCAATAVLVGIAVLLFRRRDIYT